MPKIRIRAFDDVLLPTTRRQQHGILRSHLDDDPEFIHAVRILFTAWCRINAPGTWPWYRAVFELSINNRIARRKPTSLHAE
jgi:hypothetical protein